MLVTVKLVGGLMYRAGFSHKELDVKPGTTVADILAEVGIDPAWPKIVARNGWAVANDDEVAAGDRILVSPVFSGG
jgi:sulfur carrier protein ThiS